MDQLNQLAEIGEIDFDEGVLKSNIPVLVDFFTPPCGPCKALLPVLERIAGNFPNIRVFKVNAWDNRELCGRYKIMGVPALLFFNKGQNVSRIVGFDETTEKRVEDTLREMGEN
jgi:thioredoxin